ncbi:MAG: fasciclin domain-containing protein [Actinomycetota bacterium]
MRLLLRSLAALLAVALVVALAPWAASATNGFGGSDGKRDDAYVAISRSSDRSDAVALDGATVDRSGHAAIFLAPLDVDASRVRYFVNGVRYKTEHMKPYDLRGTRLDGTAAMIAVDHLPEGENTIEARVRTRQGKWYKVPATFTVTSNPDPDPAPPALPTIAEIATGDEQFSTLVTALTEASKAGPTDFLAAVSDPNADLTVFAPTNDAFAALGDTLDAALADPSGLLTTVLAYHVLATSETGEELVAAQTATTLQGENVTITARDGHVFINDSQVVIADVPAANGIVHVIDAVLLPPSITNPDPDPAPPTPAPPVQTVTIEGSIVDSQQQPVAGASAYLFALGGGYLGFTYLGQAPATDGTYSFQASAGCFLVVLTGPVGYTFTSTNWTFMQGNGCHEPGSTMTVSGVLTSARGS